MLVMLFLNGAAVEKITLALHSSPGEPTEEEHWRSSGGGGRSTRFLIDLVLSILGPVQIDGLVKERQFDLILRPRTALPQTVRHGYHRPVC